VTDRPSRSLLREPFVHFVLLGAAIFALWGLVGEAEPPPSTGSVQVVLGGERILELESGFATTHGRAPSEQERAELVRDAVADEVLYREGMKAGLSRGDPIVRRRLVQKMRFLLQEMSPVPEPSEADLHDWIEARGAAGRPVPAGSIRQLFFDAEQRVDARGDAARALAVALAGDGLPEADPFLFGHELGLRDIDRFRSDFGPAFAQALLELPEGAWGLAESPWGWHLVQVLERVEPGERSSASLRTQARSELLRERREEAVRRSIDELVAGYDVTVDLAAP
jgi:hypothetical protein